MFYDNITPLDRACSTKIIPELELIDNPVSSRGIIKIVFPEFTCVCPKTGYPDFGSIELYYQPDAKIVELKSWKLFLNSFRMVGTFHETVTQFIFSTVEEKIAPKWAMVIGDYFPRGNVDTTIVLETESPRPLSMDPLLTGKAPHSRSFHG
ncbi:MAG: preQ(1) synthase [Fibrobacterota bacterium]